MNALAMRTVGGTILSGDKSMPKGWYFDLAANPSPVFGIVLQLGGNYETFEVPFSVNGLASTATVDLKVHEILGGVRLHARSRSTVVPFAEALAGAFKGSVAVSATTPIELSLEDFATDFGLEVGGGVDFGLRKAVSLRVGADYLRVFEEEGGGNVFRFTAGIVIGR